MDDSDEIEQLVERAAALDIGKAGRSDRRGVPKMCRSTPQPWQRCSVWPMACAGRV